MGAEAPRLVVMLHGLMRTRLTMRPLGCHLEKAGYRVLNVGYLGPAGVERSLRQVDERIRENLDEGQLPDFVTHSMGGILARAWIQQATAERGPATEHEAMKHDVRPPRLVQLAPPNQGALISSRVGRLPGIGRFQVLHELGRHAEGGPATVLDPISSHEVGVIAGRSYGPWLGPEENDGLVRVAETWLPEARDWIVVDAFHSLIMGKREVWEHVDSFLSCGRFRPEGRRLRRDPDGALTS